MNVINYFLLDLTRSGAKVKLKKMNWTQYKINNATY